MIAAEKKMKKKGEEGEKDKRQTKTMELQTKYKDIYTNLLFKI